MKNRPCYIIAEIGVNHNGSIELAKKLIDVAIRAEADAVKFQTFKAEDLVTPTLNKAIYQAQNTKNEGTQFEMLQALEFGEPDFFELAEYCSSLNIEFLSTPFSFDAVDLLDRVGVKRYKFSSGDLTYLGLLEYAAQKQKPMIISTGMAILSEIEDALNAIYRYNNREVSVLHCVSNYPAKDEEINLAAMDAIQRAFNVDVGWSDHSLGSTISFAAVARGAKIIEKHITLDQSLPGPDHLASMEPEEFNEFVAGIRSIERAIGNGLKIPNSSEVETAKLGRRSLVATRDLPAGTVVSSADIKIVRPGTGILPKHLNNLKGMTLTKDVAADQPFNWADVKNG